MREIKFQAWLGHAMVQVVKLNFMKNVVGEYVRTGEGYFLDGKNKGIHTGFVMSKVKLREYTGLHDKNGREIYEGDIVTFGSWDEDIEEEWRHTPALVEYKQNEAAFYLTRSCNIPLAHQKNIEVIGNIFENAERWEELK